MPDNLDESDVLDLEILRLRDHALGEQARAEVLADRVVELENELHILGAATEELAAELERTPLSRIIRLLRRVAPAK